MVDYLQGRFWLNSDAFMDVINTSSNGGIVHTLDSAGLVCDIEPLTYILDGVTKTFAAVIGQAVAANDTNFIYIDDSNTLVINTTGFPVSGCYYALAIVTTNSTKVLQVIQVNQAIESIASGVTSVTANSPLTQSGPASAPIIDLPDATALASGAMSSADFTKLLNIEAQADKTDVGNVTPALESIITAVGNLLTKDGVGLDEIIPGAIGEVLTSNGPGNLPTYQGLSNFAPQVLVARADTGLGPGILPYNSARWISIFSVGAAAVNGTDPNIIDLPIAGNYIAISIMAHRGTDPVHVNQFNSPPNPGTKVGKATFGKNRPGVFATGSLTTLAGVVGPQQLALETTGSNFGTNGVDTTDSFENILVVFKVSN